MSDNILTEFQQQESETTALAVQLNRWSLVMIELMIQEQEGKLLASDLPVELDASGLTAAAGHAGPETDDFWEELT